MRKNKIYMNVVYLIIIMLVILAQSYISTYIIISYMGKSINQMTATTSTTTTTGQYPQWFVEWENTEYIEHVTQ
jgi:hypothetical protein